MNDLKDKMRQDENSLIANYEGKIKDFSNVLKNKEAEYLSINKELYNDSIQM